MASQSPRFIYFDLGNVLLHFDHEVSCQQMAAVSGVDHALVNQVVFESDLQWRYERGEFSSAKFFETFCEQTSPKETPKSEDLLHAASAMFQLNTCVLPILAHLKAVGNRIGILSNTCAAHWNYVTGHYRIINDLFDVYALSFELKYMKPENEIYTKAADLAGVAPSDILFIDDRQENVEAARTVGLDAIHFRGAEDLASALRQRSVRCNY